MINRNWTPKEVELINSFPGGEFLIECMDDWAVVSQNGDMTEPRLVQIFAVGDNLYICHQAVAAEIYTTDFLLDCLQQAVEYASQI